MSCDLADQTPNGSWLVYDDVSYLRTAEGVLSVGASCAEVEPIAIAESCEDCRGLFADSEQVVFGVSDGGLNAVAVHALDGSLLATVPAVPGSDEGEYSGTQWAQPRLVSLGDRAWLVGTAQLSGGISWPHIGMADFTSGALSFELHANDTGLFSRSTSIVAAERGHDDSLVLVTQNVENNWTKNITVTRWNSDGTLDTRPVPQGGGALGSCTDSTTGICSEVTGGNVEGFRDSCDVDGIWSSGACPRGSASYTCTGVVATSNVDGSSLTVNILYPSNFCSAYPGIDNQGSCLSSGGTGMGQPCQRP